METVTISKEEYTSLLEDSKKLHEIDADLVKQVKKSLANYKAGKFKQVR